MSETEAGARLDEERVKMLTGQDAISARAMREDTAEYRPTAKLMVLTNPKPVITSNEHAIWRRLHLVPCRATVSDADANPYLAAELAKEMTGILAWAVEGARLLHQEKRLKPADCMKAATDEYRSEMDVLGLWLSERCDVAPTLRHESQALYRSYHAYVTDRGESPFGARLWQNMMADRGMKPVRITSTTRGWQGLALRA